MLNNDKCLLVFGFKSEEKEKLEAIVKKENLPEVREITEIKTSMKIGDIIDGLQFEVINKKKLPNERVVLFNNLSDDELDKAIKVIRSNHTPMPILAVITDTSINWTFEYLLEHLIEEREWHRSREKRGN